MLKNKIFILLLLLFFCIACGKKHINQIVEPDMLYNQAISLFKRGKFEKASEKFLEFKNRFPFDSRIIEVEIKYCDSLYKAEKYIEAENAYLEFIKLHPKNKLVPYAYYQLGMIQFNQISTIDRDQSKLHYAYNYFSHLVKKFPDTRYAVVANHRMFECRRKMAKNNFLIGYFYFKQERYKASIARFEKILRKYPGFIDDKVLYYLGKSYIDIGQKDKGKQILGILVKKYPKSRYHFRALQAMKTLKPDKFKFFARLKEYYFMDEEDLKDRYFTAGMKSFSYPPSSNIDLDAEEFNKKKRTIVTLKTSKNIQQEYKKTEDIAVEKNRENQIPVNVSANEVSYLEKGFKVIFRGNVIVSRGNFLIKTDKLIAYLNKKDKKIYKVEALDGVDIYYLTREGRCKKATYYVNEDKIILEGEPFLKDNNNIVNGKKIIYFVKEQKIFVVGDMKQRGKFIIEER